ncbi:hypothetical protein NQ318_013743 [Aromia moschata]|uniref:DUF4817 domain-containing protein n=1 Tax=Aromia moschata TaxID=1265417 RepID=A0AAV8Z856_9CUCU|nr:hypothetical protein NQ318_013743 [Aromia moschata]
MAQLTVTQRIEILIFIGCGNKIRTQQELCNLFNAKYPDNPITQSTVSKIESKFRETGDVKDLPKSGHTKIDIVLSMEENPQSTSTLVASENEISQTTVLRILRKENCHPYKFQLEFHGHHRKGHVLNFNNMSLSNFSVANSTSYEALKSDVPGVAFSAETG